MPISYTRVTVTPVLEYQAGAGTQERAHQFFDQYISGANLPDRSAVLTLRNRMARIRLDRISRPEQLALFIRAWNAFREGKPLSQIIIAKGDLTNLNFPQPK